MLEGPEQTAEFSLRTMYDRKLHEVKLTCQPNPCQYIISLVVDVGNENGFYNSHFDTIILRQVACMIEINFVFDSHCKKRSGHRFLQQFLFKY